MSIKCGIVGLPNVGKSTLFNALTNSLQAEAANYPFCTIEPNLGTVTVPDKRLQKLAELNNSKKIIPTQIEFVDIAGLVRGASKGEGLGNKFLAHIRGVDAICYVVRCFEDDDVIHVSGKVNPVTDAEVIETELILADIESLGKQLVTAQKKQKQDKSLAAKVILIEKLLAILDTGEPAVNLLTKSNESCFKELNLLTAKPFIYICNIKEEDIVTGNDMSRAMECVAHDKKTLSINICAQIEQEINDLKSDIDKTEFFEALGIKERGLNKLIASCYCLLNLQTFFTSSVQETRAWTLPVGMTARQAAGVIHTDFSRGFICAETISYQDYIRNGSEQEAKINGDQRKEGRDYIVCDGDILLFRFNV